MYMVGCKKFGKFLAFVRPQAKNKTDNLVAKEFRDLERVDFLITRFDAMLVAGVWQMRHRIEES
jgi:hypothetical protein